MLYFCFVVSVMLLKSTFMLIEIKIECIPHPILSIINANLLLYMVIH